MLVLALTAAMMINTVDLTVLEVSAETEVAGAAVASGVKITGFLPLEEGAGEQQLPLGAPESDIIFPESLTVTVEGAADTAVSGNDAVSGGDRVTGGAQMGTTSAQLTLEGITWQLDASESDADCFDSSEEADGFCYVYRPVLPETDNGGNTITLEEGVALPEIYVLVGEPGVMLLAGNAVTPTQKEVSYVYRSYDEATGEVKDEQITGTANVLDQEYANGAAEEDGRLFINKNAESDFAALWVVNGDVTISGMLIFNGNVTLVLADGAKLQTDETWLNCGQLTICGQEKDSGQYTGKTIYSKGRFYSPRLEISGGTIEMKNNGTSVAIGSQGAYTTVVINGGTVTAEITGDFAAIGGIGGSNYTDEDKNDNFGSVEIHGGTVTAVTNNHLGSTNNAAAIGRGGQGFNGSVIITGGTVKATYDITSKSLQSTTPAICAGNMQIKNVKLQGYGDDEATAETGNLSYPYREIALTKHYISLTECTHDGGDKKYVSGQSIMEGCVDCGANENLRYTLTGFTLDGRGETLAEERQYGEKQTTLEAVLKDADGKPVTENVTWKWYDNNTVISGAIGSTYTTPLNLAAGTHVFRAEATIDGLTLTGDDMTVTVNRRTVGIAWGQTEFYYASKTEYIIDPRLTDVVEGDEVSLEFDTTGYYTVTINGTEYKDKKFPANKHSEVGTYCNAVKLTGAAKDNYILENGEVYEFCQWSVRYFTDAEALLSGAQDENGNYTGRVKLTAPDGTLLHVDGKDVEFQYYSGEGDHTVSYYLVKEGDTQYRGKDWTVSFTIAADGSQSNTGEVSRIKDRDIVYFGTYDPAYTNDKNYVYQGEPVAWMVLDADHTNVDTSDGMFVISEKGLGTRRSGYYYDGSDGLPVGTYTGFSYAGGSLNGWCEDFLDGKYAQRLTTQERELLKGVQKVKGDRNVTLDKDRADSYGFTWKSGMDSQGGAQFQSTNLDYPKIFLPSVEEVGLEGETIIISKGSDNGADVEFQAVKDGYFTSEEDRKIEEGAYWLRNWRESRKNNQGARFEHSYYFAQINKDGKYGTGEELFANTLGLELQMRPAANVLFSKIWFLSAVGGKSGNAFEGQLAAYSVPDDTNHWKITMKDSTATQFEAEKTNLDENQITISYTNARTGEKRYLSAVVEDENGTVTFYGRLKKLTSDTDKSGEVTFDIPTGVEQGNKVFVYEEQFNGDYLVDYAGPLVQVHQVRTPDVTVWEKTDLVYDGTEHELVTLEKLKNGTIEYRLGPDGVWGSKIPKAKNAGDYTVYYWVKGDDMYDNVGSRKNPKSVSVTVSPKELGVVWGETELTYNGTEQAPKAEPDPADLVAGDQVTLTVTQKGKDKGDYTASVSLSDADTNYVLRSQSDYKEFTILPKPVTVTITSQGGVYGGSNPGAAAVLNGIEAADQNEQINQWITLTYTGISYKGESVNMMSTPTDAGEYTVTVSLTHYNYILTGETSAQYNVAARDIASREIAVEPITKSFLGIGNSVRLEYIDIKMTDNASGLNSYLEGGTDYKLAAYTDNDSISTAEKPARVRITGCGNYTGEREISFQIGYEAGINDKAATASPDAWTKDTVTITAPNGYKICQEKAGAYAYDYDNDFTADFTVDSESTSSAGTTVSYYLQNMLTKAVSEKKELVIKIDRTAPVFGENEGISIKNSFWNQLLRAITFGLYTPSADVTITASDSLSGIQKYFYYVDTATDKANYTVLTAEALDALTFTEASGGKFRLGDEGNKVVYAYAEDQAGNRSAYICSDGIVVDNDGPQVELSVPDEKRKDISATVNFRVDEEVTIYYLLSRTDLSGNTSVASLEGLKTLSGAESRAVTEEEAGKELSLAFNDLSANTTYYLYAAAEDMAGNESNVESTTFTTLKTIPYIEMAPVLSGAYGATLEAMIQTDNAKVVAAEGSTTVLSGTWSVTDAAQKNIYPVVEDTQAYSLTFTPTGADAAAYSTVSCEAVPVVSPKQVKVGISPATRSYGEANPAFDYSVEADGLAGSDTKDDLKITLETAANETSGVGSYEISGTWNNKNYKVSFMGIDGAGDWSVDGHGILTVTKAANQFTTVLSCADITFKENVSATATAKYGDVKYLYAEKTGTTGPDASAYGDKVPDQAGDYCVKAYVEGTDNYAGLESAAVSFTIKKAAAPVLTGDTVYVNYAKGIDTSVDVLGKLPEDKGSTSVHVQKTDAENIIAGCYWDNSDAKLHYQVNPVTDSSMVGKTAEITATMSMRNYEDAVYVLTITLTDKTIVELKSGSDVILTGSNVLHYGAQLKDLALNTGAMFVEQGTETEVPGTLAWKQPDMIPAVGTIQAEWTFTPADLTQYAELTGFTEVVVEKAKPAVTAPVADSVIYSPDRSIADLPLQVGGENGKAVASVGGVEKTVSGDWTWNDTDPDSVIPTVGNSGYEAKFTPKGEDAKNYEPVIATVALKVEQAEPYIVKMPTAAAITYGQSLSQSALSGIEAVYGDGQGHAGSTTVVSGAAEWKDKEAKPVVADSETTEYTVVFKPADTVNYKTVELPVKLTVEKAKHTPSMPGNTMNVAYSCTKVSSVQLPDTWEWQAADKDRALEAGVTVTATAVYAGADKGNYETESVVIEITRSACEHAQTELRNTREATCTVEGYTGDTYCMVCGAMVKNGTATAATGHSYTAQVTKQPTTAEEGVRTYTCGSCGHSYTESIAKLPGGTDQGGTDQGGTNQSNTDQGGTDQGNTDQGSTGQGNTDQGSAGQGGTNQSNTSQSGSNRPDSKKPFIKGAGGKEGWEVIRGELKTAKEGGTISVDMNGSTTVPGDVFEQIKGKNVTLVLDMGAGITWSINGNDVKADRVEDIDLGVTIGEKAGLNIPVEVINNLTGERYFMNLTLAYDGEFGFQATLTINMDAKNAGLYANLFYYNAQSGELEFVCAGEIGEHGAVSLTFTHASDYTIIIDRQSMAKSEDSGSAGGDNTESTEKVTEGNTESTEETEESTESTEESQAEGSAGDDVSQTDAEAKSAGSLWFLLIGCAVAIAAAGIILFLKKKKEE